MPKERDLRGEGVRRIERFGKPRDGAWVAFEGRGGGTRLDAPRGAWPSSNRYMQPARSRGASATGGHVVTSRRSQRADGMSTLPTANASSVAPPGVSANPRRRTQSRASLATSAMLLKPTLGTGAPALSLIENGCNDGSQRGLG